MNFGFNSNVRVGAALFHVQTEDRGPTHPFLDTVVYLSGRVVHKRSVSYKAFAAAIAEKDLPEKLHERLALQHREVIAELEAGTIAILGQTPPRANVVLDEEEMELQLLNPKSWFADGVVTLEISVNENPSKKKIPGAEVQVFVEQQKQRIPCAEARTDSEGLITLKFPMPAEVADGATLVVRATDDILFGELRFRLKAKSREDVPVPASK
ncbi:MAG TPA: hypothetical protein VFE02_09475 [Candidatus Acidoferrales bacterium]|jgi:hypothetical protein|nr:hypothetical protein [Candidatus Acidoferrales bacterium]